MNETRTTSSFARRILIPLVVAVVLVVGTVLIAGSTLIRIEDVTLNRIVAGTFGTPDWRVLEMNPLLSQLLTLLYRIGPAVNWYGVLLLGLLLAAAAAGISLTARKRGGLIPAIIVVGPIVVLLTNSMISTVVCALCVAVGALSLMDGLHRRKEGVARLVVGIVLFALAAMLSLSWALVIGLCVALCWLPRMVREERVRGLLIGLPIMVVILAALFGYSSLMYASPEMSAYRNDNALYERLQHSSLKGEYEGLIESFGTATYSTGYGADEHAGHDHDGDGVPDGADHVHEDDIDTVIPAGTFEKVGWDLNDASLFFTRYSADAKLTDPDVLRELEAEASFWDFTPSRLLPELLNTVKKPQFLLLMALFVVSALAVLLTSRGRGFVVLLAAVIGFGGHIAMLAHYYDAFANIAPFYLVAIAIMLYTFDGEAAKDWLHRVFKAPWLRIGLCALALAVFVAGMGGLLYYTRGTDPYGGTFTPVVIDFLKPYIQAHPEMLFIGENPNERLKPATLEAPVRNENPSLLAGSYDLYSPRSAALKAQFDIENPLVDGIGRDDVGYVLMGFSEPIIVRLANGYELYVREPKVLLDGSEAPYPLSEMIMQLQVMTQEEYEGAILYQEALDQMARELEEAFAEVNKQFEESGDTADHDHTEDDHDHDHDHDHDEDDHDHDHDADVTPEPSATKAPDA